MDVVFYMTGLIVILLGGLAFASFLIVFLIDFTMRKTMRAKELMDIIFIYTKERRKNAANGNQRTQKM